MTNLSYDMSGLSLSMNMMKVLNNFTFEFKTFRVFFFKEWQENVAIAGQVRLLFTEWLCGE